MRLFIQIREGQPYEHPIFEDNFRQAFPCVDVDNLPSEFANFERVAHPEADSNIRLFKIYRLSYQWVGNVVKDVWTLGPMTDAEKEEALDIRVTAINNKLALNKEYAQYKINIETGVGLVAWTDYLNTLNSFTYQRVDAFEVSVPPPPRRNLDGEWATTQSSGSAPNVIG